MTSLIYLISSIFILQNAPSGKKKINYSYYSEIKMLKGLGLACIFDSNFYYADIYKKIWLNILNSKQLSHTYS